MRKKAERQVPLDFRGGSKLSREHHRLYFEIDRLLNQNPAILDAVHTDLAECDGRLIGNDSAAGDRAGDRGFEPAALDASAR